MCRWGAHGDKLTVRHRRGGRRLALVTVLVLLAMAAGIGVTISKLQAGKRTVALATPTANPDLLGAATPGSSGAAWLISGVHFTSSQDGWVITASSADRGPRTILHTMDGGENWTPVLSWDGNYSIGRSGLQQISMQFVDRSHIFVLDPQSGQAHGTLFKTGDGGKTWQPLGLPGSPGPGSALTFVDANHGWLLADVGAAMGQSSATVFQTVDGGSHWTVVVHVDYGQTSNGLSSAGDKDSVVFLNSSAGWMTSNGPSGPFIYGTVDGGRDWHLATSLPTGLSSSGVYVTPYPPQFFNLKAGLFPFDFQAQFSSDVLYIYVTNDGGAHWNQVRRTPATAIGSAPLYWHFLDPLHWWIGSGARLWTTADGGASWSMANLPLSRGSVALAASFVDSRNGYLVVGSGFGSGSQPSATTLLKTVDGGARWKAIPLSGLGEAASPELCGDWSSLTSPTGASIAAQYGEIRSCAPRGASRSTWVITTLSRSQTEYGGVLIYRCTTSSCSDGSADHPIAGWRYYPAPYCCAVTLLGTPSPSTLLIDSGGHQLTFDTITGVYSQ